MNKKKSGFTAAYIAKVAMLGVLAYIVMLIEFALPFFPSFLKMDFSDLVPLVGSLALGPLAGVLSELIKVIFHWITASTTGGVGDIANFIVGAAFVGTAGLYYKYHKTKAGAIIALVLSTIVMVIVGALVNYFIMVPFYAAAFFKDSGGVDGVVKMSAAVIPAIKDKMTLILFAFCPFNFLKGIVLTVITVPLYKHISPLLKKEHIKHSKDTANA